METYDYQLLSVGGNIFHLLMVRKANNLKPLFIYHSAPSSDKYLHSSYMQNMCKLPKIFISFWSQTQKSMISLSK